MPRTHHPTLRLLPLLLVLLPAIIAIQPSGAAPPQASFSANTRVNSTQTDQQQEPTLAVNPKDPQHLIAAAKDWRSGHKEVWHYRSSDGGATWADAHLPGLPADLPNQSDPVVLYNADGVAYTSVIAYDQDDFTKGGLFVARSTDDGATWSQPVPAQPNKVRIFNDKEWLTVDRSATATRGTLYLTWTRFTTISDKEERGDIVAIRSTDEGVTWSAPVQISRAADQSDVQGSFPAVGPAGDLNVLYFDQTGKAGLWLGRSTDGGVSFVPPVKVAVVHNPPSPLPTSKFRMFVLPQLAINPLDGTLAATWNDYPGNSDVLLTTSHDNGRTWSAPARLNSDSGSADQFFPTLIFGPDGVLHVAWLDRRDDPHNLTFSPYYTQSRDDGRSFAPEVRIGDAQSDPSIGFGGTLIGDYIQVDAVAGRAAVAWVDTRLGDQNIYTVNINGPLADAIPLPTATAGPAPAAPVTPAPAKDFVDPAFARVWERSDRPVRDGLAARPWIWGPAPFAAGNEPYAQGPNGQRLVQYFDKARMEINNPAADSTAKWFVTNGLLVVEMMTGQVQTGDREYDPTALPPNAAPVAGDVDSPDAPTYATMARVSSLHGDNRAEDRTGAPITATLDRNGAPGDGVGQVPAGVTQARYEPTLGHNIPTVFAAFQARQGLIYQNGRLVQGSIVDPLVDLGYPISESYWARIRIAGADQWALIQAYQRRMLTYVPTNAPAWQVELGNVGRHYYDWRYGPHSRYAEEAGEDTDNR
ncbi:MAG: glycoside hydrolase [Chloroflexota bacterium]|nr:glycoside hydrolase [Chloroflexota bacterium]